MGGGLKGWRFAAPKGVYKSLARSSSEAKRRSLPIKCPNRASPCEPLQPEFWLRLVVNNPLSRLMIVTALVAALCACSSSKSSHTADETQQLSPRVIRVGDPVPKGGGVWKLGEPYLAGGKWYVPINDQSYDRVGLASWYGDFFHGRRTANGEVYDMNSLTGAHPTLPLPTYVTVTNLANNRTIVVRINDRGPYHDGRIIDLSHRAARELGFSGHGTAAVRVRYLGPAPMNGDDSYERSVLSRQPWSTQVLSSAPSPVRPQNAILASAITTEWPIITKKGDFEYRQPAPPQGWAASAQPVSGGASSLTSGR